MEATFNRLRNIIDSIFISIYTMVLIGFRLFEQENGCLFLEKQLQ